MNKWAHDKLQVCIGKTWTTGKYQYWIVQCIKVSHFRQSIFLIYVRITGSIYYEHAMAFDASINHLDINSLLNGAASSGKADKCLISSHYQANRRRRFITEQMTICNEHGKQIHVLLFILNTKYCSYCKKYLMSVVWYQCKIIICLYI